MEHVDMQVRVFEDSDTKQVIALWNKCGLLRPWNDPQLDILRKQSVGADLFLVGLESNRIIGSVMGGYDGHRGWMNYLAVDPEYRTSGCGREIVSHLECKLKARGCPKINLQIRSDNSAVLEFYRRLGYAVDEVSSMGKRLITDTEQG